MTVFGESADSFINVQKIAGPIEVGRPSMAKQFGFMVNLLMLFQRLHECQQLPGLLALPVGTLLGYNWLWKHKYLFGYIQIIFI